MLIWPFVALASPRWVLAASPWSRPGAHDLGADFDAFVDVLLPADETPGALDLNIPQKLRLQAATRAELQRFLIAGTEALAALSRRSLRVEFHRASCAQREALVVRVEQQRDGELLRRWFERVRRDSFAFYYADPRSWPGLGFQGAPQPRGYPDFQRAPR